MKLTDLMGKKFGRLTVIRRSYPNAKEGKAMWLCKCDCGKERTTRGDSLSRGGTKSCGCLKSELSRDRRRLGFGLGNMRSLISCYKASAKKRGLEWNLTEEQFLELTKQDCYYCGAKPNGVMGHKENYGDYVYNGLDRIDNNKGYTIDNVVPCCRICNQSKSTLTIQEFEKWIKRVNNNIPFGTREING